MHNAFLHHSLADDMQPQMSAAPDNISELLHSLQSCIGDVNAWATANILKLNGCKTDLMLVTSKRTRHLHNLPTSITIGYAQIPFKHSVKNFGLTLDCHLTMNAHVSNIARTCYFVLRRFASIRRFLTSTATATLVSTFVLSRIDYSNSLLFGSTHDVTSHLQRMQNYAARAILRLPMSSNITTHLKSLYWLVIKVRCTYKIACLCYHCHSSTAPSYVTDMLQKKSSHVRNTRFSSYTMPLLNRPVHSKATRGDSYLFIDGLSQKIYYKIKSKEVKLITSRLSANLNALVYNAYLLNAVCLHNAFFLPLTFSNAFWFHAFSWVIDT